MLQMISWYNSTILSHVKLFRTYLVFDQMQLPLSLCDMCNNIEETYREVNM